MKSVISKTLQNFQCTKCKSKVMITTETIGVFSGDSGLPLETFKRKTCASFPQVPQCGSCDYSPLKKAVSF